MLIVSSVTPIGMRRVMRIYRNYQSFTASTAVLFIAVLYSTSEVIIDIDINYFMSNSKLGTVILPGPQNAPPPLPSGLRVSTPRC